MQSLITSPKLMQHVMTGCAPLAFDTTVLKEILYVNNTPLIQSQATKFLGAIIDQHLSWKNHVTKFQKNS